MKKMISALGMVIKHFQSPSVDITGLKANQPIQRKRIRCKGLWAVDYTQLATRLLNYQLQPANRNTKSQQLKMLPMWMLWNTHPPTSLLVTAKSKERRRRRRSWTGECAWDTDQTRTSSKGPFLESPHKSALTHLTRTSIGVQPRGGTRWGNPSQPLSSNCLIKFRVKPAAKKGQGWPSHGLENS